MGFYDNSMGYIEWENPWSPEKINQSIELSIAVTRHQAANPPKEGCGQVVNHESPGANGDIWGPTVGI